MNATKALSNFLDNWSKNDSEERLRKYPIGTKVIGENTYGKTVSGTIIKDEFGFLYIKAFDKGYYKSDIHQVIEVNLKIITDE